MRPDLRKQLLASSVGQVPSKHTNALAVVKQEDPMDTNGHLNKGNRDSAKDMVYHESFSRLINEIKELRQRCDSLEEANAELKSDMRAIEQTHADVIAQKSPKCETIAAVDQGNLAAYASSESSNLSETMVFGKSAHQFMGDKADIEHFKVFINTKLDAMTKILEAFQMNLSAEGVARYNLGEDLERTKNDATKTKGRIDALDTKMKKLRTEFDGRNVPTAKEIVGLANRVGQHEDDRIQQYQAKLTGALAQIAALNDRLEAHSDDIHDLQAQAEGGPTRAVPQTVLKSARDYANNISNSAPKATSSEPDMTFIKDALQTMTRRATMQQIVDDMYSKDQLYLAYKQLSQVVEDTSMSTNEEIHAIAQFSGSHDELWSLRDRVVRCLALFDSYGKALEEARAAEVDF